MTTLVIAAVICILGAIVFLLAPPKFDQVGYVFMLSGAFAITALLCGLL
jgi:hypothetical protein